MVPPLHPQHKLAQPEVRIGTSASLHQPVSDLRLFLEAWHFKVYPIVLDEP